MKPPSGAIKKRIFYAVALAIPLLLVVMLETGLRLIDYGDSLDLFIPAPAEVGAGGYWMTNPKVAQRYFPKQGYYPRPRRELFLKHKPENGYRIFVLGGSTAASWPYPANVMFSRILAQRLADTFPERHIEVVNVAISAVNSFTLLDFMDEVLAHQPDAILIYAGHNEFYGALGAASSRSVGQQRWLVRLYLKLLHFKTVQLLRDGVNEFVWRFLGGARDERPTLMGTMVGEESVALGSETFKRAQANFAANLREILARGQAAGVAMMLSEVVSNLRDQPPFVSTRDTSGRSADDYYAEAQALEAERKFEQARQAYIQAKELDGLRFRAPEAFNNLINQIGAEAGVAVVPMRAYFERAARHGIVGADLMLEHLHPNVEGTFLLAEAFYDTMRQQGFIASQWPAARGLDAQAYRQAWPITDVDRALGEIRIINLTDHWPYPPKPEGARTIDQFEPRSDAERLAFKTFRNQISYRQAHLEMAKLLRARGENGAALREYLALVRAAPFNINAYLTAIPPLLEARRFDRALPLLQSSRRIKETAYANKWLGQIYLIRRRPLEAQPFLLRARQIDPEDMQTLYSLGMSQALAGDFVGAAESLALLEAVEPHSWRSEKLRRLIRPRQ